MLDAQIPVLIELVEQQAQHRQVGNGEAAGVTGDLPAIETEQLATLPLAAPTFVDD